MRILTLLALALLASCNEEERPPPAPQELSAGDISHYDQMIVLDRL